MWTTGCPTPLGHGPVELPKPTACGRVIVCCLEAMAEIEDFPVDACDALLALWSKALIKTPLLGCGEAAVEVDGRIRDPVAVGLIAETCRRELGRHVDSVCDSAKGLGYYETEQR